MAAAPGTNRGSLEAWPLQSSLTCYQNKHGVVDVLDTVKYTCNIIHNKFVLSKAKPDTDSCQQTVRW